MMAVGGGVARGSRGARGGMGRTDLGLWLIFAGGRTASAPNIPCRGGSEGVCTVGGAPGADTVSLFLEHVLQWPRQVLDDSVQDALIFLLRLIPAAWWDSLLGSSQTAFCVGFHGCLGLRLALLLLLDAIL